MKAAGRLMTSWGHLAGMRGGKTKDGTLYGARVLSLHKKDICG